MLWVGGGQGAGKTTLSWHLSRAHDLPLHRIDLWTYDHQARMPSSPAGRSSRCRPSPDWPAIAAAIESALAPALETAPRLAPGGELSRQRRHENEAADRQGRLWMRAAGLPVMPEFPFGCECGASGCRVTWAATPADYAARTASGRRLIAHDIP